MWRRRLRAEKQARNQAERSDGAGEICTARIKSAPANSVRITANETVAIVDGGTIVKIGNDHDIGLIISHTSFEPTFPLGCIVGGTHVCVPITASDLKPSKSVHQKDIDHTGYCVATIKGRGAVFQDVDVINHRKWNEVDVHSGGAGPGTKNTAAPHYGGAFPIDQNQSLLGQQSTQIWYDAAVPEAGHVLVGGRAHFLRQADDQVRGVANA